jgi:hypothetical protein
MVTIDTTSFNTRQFYFLPARVGGVFKKKRNFLNIAPTSIESALQLLSAPSVKF